MLVIVKAFILGCVDAHANNIVNVNLFEIFLEYYISFKFWVESGKNIDFEFGLSGFKHFKGDEAWRRLFKE